MDFVGFTFNKRHSVRDLGLLRVSTSNRYTTNLAPTMTDFTAQNNGADGQYFFGSVSKQLQFTVDFAFDSLTEDQIRELRQLFNGREEGELIFDEHPYKAYRAKVTKAPQLKTICFMEGGKRIYKGEGNVVFTCYWPYGYTPDWVWTTSDGAQFAATSADGRLAESYGELAYPTKSEWLTVSRLTSDTLINYGELPAPFTLTVSGLTPASTPSQITVSGTTLSITAPTQDLISAGQIYDLVWDSQCGLVYGLYNKNGVPAKVALEAIGDARAKIPVRAKAEASTNTTTDLNLKYNYWYY